MTGYCDNRSPVTGFVCVREPGHEPPHQAAWAWGNNPGPTWTDLPPKEGNPPRLSVPGPRYRIDNLRLTFWAWWLRLLSAIRLGVNEFRAPSKADPKRLGTAYTGQHRVGTAREIPTPHHPPPHTPDQCSEYTVCPQWNECSAAACCLVYRTDHE